MLSFIFSQGLSGALPPCRSELFPSSSPATSLERQKVLQTIKIDRILIRNIRILIARTPDKVTPAF